MKKKKPITLNKSKIEKIKSQVCDEATSRATLIFLLAAKDELKLNDDKLVRVAERTSLYAEHINNKLVDLRQVQDILESKTGLKFVGW